MARTSFRKRGQHALFVALVVFLHGAGAHSEPAPLPPTNTELLSPSISSPSPPAEGWKRASIATPVCATPPVIDGRIDDAAWRTATRAEGFYRYGSTAAVTEQTEAWICADNKNLYFAFHCLDSQPERIVARETQRNGGVSRDDFVGVDIDSQNSRRRFSTFLVNPLGTQYEDIEGGTADNITWAGDWKAAARRTRSGWTAEMAIPFSLLRYPQGTQSFGMLLYRKQTRETFLQAWPYMPIEAASNDREAQFLQSFTGITPPFYVPRPLFLPFLLTRAGAQGSVREGLDVKYPLSTTLTGVATLFPDFQTIEQDVTSINFSYTEKFVNDRRPFFAEGAQFLPSNDLFYSRRVEDVDGGLKVVGKNNSTSLGLLGTTARGDAGRSAWAFQLRHDIGLLSQLRFALVGDTMNNKPSNRVARMAGTYGWQRGVRQFTISGHQTRSWQGGSVRDGSDSWNFSTNAGPARPQFRVSYLDIGPTFTSDLGFVPEKNRRGVSTSLWQFNEFAKGPVESYDVDLDLWSYQRHTGGFFRAGGEVHLSVRDRSGRGFELSGERSRRDQFQDNVQGAELFWGDKTLFQRGGIRHDFGRQAGETYAFSTLGQSFLLTRPLSLQLNWSRLRLGEERETQTIVTGTYRLSATQILGSRLVQQGGGTNVYFSFGQRVRAGTDLFVLLGDPNSARTQGSVTVKLVRPV